MSFSLAQARTWNFAKTLMVTIVLFHAGNGGYGVMPAAEFDGDPASIVHEHGPFA